MIAGEKVFKNSVVLPFLGALSACLFCLMVALIWMLKHRIVYAKGTILRVSFKTAGVTSHSLNFILHIVAPWQQWSTCWTNLKNTSTDRHSLFLDGSIKISNNLSYLPNNQELNAKALKQENLFCFMFPSLVLHHSCLAAFGLSALFAACRETGNVAWIQ